MNLFKKVLFTAAELVPVKLLQKLNHPSLLLPYHHVVSDVHLPHISNMYPYKNIRQFTDDLEWLLKHYNPIHPKDLAQCIFERKPLPHNSFLLTFDDGFREVADIIAPILLRKGVPAIFFINPAFIDNNILFYRCKLSLILEQLRNNNNPDTINAIRTVLNIQQKTGNIKEQLLNIHYPQRATADTIGTILGLSFEDFLQQQKPFLSTDQLTKLYQDGFTIGGHSIDHPHYKFLGEEEQIMQTLKSLPMQSDLLAPNYKYFSFPHQDHTIKQNFFNTLLQQNKLLLFGTQNQKIEPFNPVLHRFNAERPEMPLSSTAKGVLIFNALQTLAGKNKIIRN